MSDVANLNCRNAADPLMVERRPSDDNGAAPVADLARLPPELRRDMEKFQELLKAADSDVLDRFALSTAINQCAIISQKTTLVEVALQRGDTTGTGTCLNTRAVLQQLCRDLLEDTDREHVEEAQTALRDKRAALVQWTEASGEHGYIEAGTLRRVLTATAPFALSAGVVSSLMRHLGVTDEAGESVRLTEVTRVLCPTLDQHVLTAINAKVMEKYGSLKTAFDALSKSAGKLSRQQLSELLAAQGAWAPLPLLSRLRLSEVEELVNLADADGSASIEYQEFQALLGTGERLARVRQDNYKKMMEKSARTAPTLTAYVPNFAQSIKGTSHLLAQISAEQRLAEVVLTREAELRTACKAADAASSGCIDVHQLCGAFNTLGLGLTEDGLAKLLSKVSLSAKEHIDYSKVLERVKALLSKASTLEEAQAEVAAALRDLIERSGDGKPWLVRGFQILDRDANLGKAKGRMGQDGLSNWLMSVRVALSHRLVADMVKIATALGENKHVTYADFVRMLGESASQLRGRREGAAGAAGNVDGLSEEMMEEIREAVKGKYDTLTNAFRSFDQDGSGSISKDEMLQGLQRLGLPLTDRQYGNIIRRADVDGGGSIDLKEFRLALETGERAESRRVEHEQERQRKLLLQQEAQTRKNEAAAAREAARLVQTVVEPVDEIVESQFWITLQQRCVDICAAFALIKGKGEPSRGLKVADSEVMSEADFSQGLQQVFHKGVSKHAESLFHSIALASGSDHLELAEFLRAHSRWVSTAGGAPPGDGKAKGAKSEGLEASEEQKREEILRRVQVEREQRFARRRDRDKVKAKEQEVKMQTVVSHAARLWTVRSVDEAERCYRERQRAKERAEQHKKLEEDKRTNYALQQETRSTGFSFTHILTRPKPAQAKKCHICRKACGVCVHALQWRASEGQLSKAAHTVVPPLGSEIRDEERTRERLRIKYTEEENRRKLDEKQRKRREAQLLVAGRNEPFPP